MRIGLFADTHDRMELIARAVQRFNSEAVDYVLHAGDYVAPFALRPFADLEADWRGVFGNNDGERAGLQKHSQGRIVDDRLVVERAGVTLLVVHEQEKGLAEARQNERIDVLICAHTHAFFDGERDGVRVINPGECCGYLSGQPTLGVLDTADLSATRLTLKV